jgi:hypothetical protein
MNTRKIIATLNLIANKLDNNGLYYISDKLTNEMIKISQTKPGFLKQLQFKAEYYDANQEFRAAGSKKDLDPEEFQLVQDYSKDLLKKEKIPKIMTPREIGKFLFKSPQDKNKLRNLLYGTTNFSQTSAPSGSSGRPIFDKNPPLGSRVESGRTSNMTDDEKVKDYVELVARNLSIHKMDKVGYWEDHAKENLSPKAYKKFLDIDEKMQDQYLTWMQDNPEAAKRINALKPQTSEDNDAVVTQTPVGNSSGLDRWVNKAENIYKSWSDKNMPEKSTAPLLIKDVLDYMIKLKNNLTPDKTTDAQAKIDKVQSFIDNIRDKKPHTGTVASYSSFTGFGGKQSDVFGGEKLNQKQLDYLAQQESKSY